MGDRGNIVVRSKHNGDVWFYTHWRGSHISDVLKAALRRKDRWNDPQYFGRIVFQELIGDDNGTTGYGVGCRMGDNEHPILVADLDKQAVVKVAEKSLVDGKLPDSIGKGVPFTKFAAD